MVTETRLEGSATLEEWLYRTRINIDTHNWAERRYDRLSTILGVSVISALVGLGVIAGSFDLTQGVGRFVALALALGGQPPPHCRLNSITAEPRPKRTSSQPDTMLRYVGQ
jgi:hypothetical protein